MILVYWCIQFTIIIIVHNIILFTYVQFEILRNTHYNLTYFVQAKTVFEMQGKHFKTVLTECVLKKYQLHNRTKKASHK